MSEASLPRQGTKKHCAETRDGEKDRRTVGWVERSETHHLRSDGYRYAQPILRTAFAGTARGGCLKIGSALKPLDRRDLVSGGLDPRDGLSCVFDHGRHVMRVGVDDRVFIPCDRDMAFPENQIPPL
jgi:hypothetical protein